MIRANYIYSRYKENYVYLILFIFFTAVLIIGFAISYFNETTYISIFVIIITKITLNGHYRVFAFGT